MTTTSVGSGSCGSSRFGSASLQLATFTTLADWAPEPPHPKRFRSIAPEALHRQGCFHEGNSARLGAAGFLTPYLTLRFIADSLPRLLSISY